MPPTATHRAPTRTTAAGARFFVARIAVLLASVFIAVCFPQASAATVFHSRTEIAELAFPDCDRVEAKDVFLSPAQRARIEQLAASPLGGDLVTIYEGYAGQRLVGYALLDTHLVRTLPETMLVVIDASGTVAATYLMAFHEPLEYRPNDRWLRLLDDRHLSDDLRVGRAIVGITGATLTARAVVASVRRALAVYEVLLAAR
jgi:hypothetical protein